MGNCENHASIEGSDAFQNIDTDVRIGRAFRKQKIPLLLTKSKSPNPLDPVQVEVPPAPKLTIRTQSNDQEKEKEIKIMSLTVISPTSPKETSCDEKPSGNPLASIDNNQQRSRTITTPALQVSTIQIQTLAQHSEVSDQQGNSEKNSKSLDRKNSNVSLKSIMKSSSLRSKKSFTSQKSQKRVRFQSCQKSKFQNSYSRFHH